MATYEEVAELASDINQKLNSQIQPDTLVYLIEQFIEDEATPFTEVPIQEIAEQIHALIYVADAFLIAQDGEDIETIETEIKATADALGLEVER